MTAEKLLLIGSPNTGKTTLFNKLTASSEHIGNWNGVTVEEKEKEFDYNNKTYSLVDLPGIYSLSSLSFEEQVSINYLILHKTEKLINICDLTCLQKNLYLTLELIEFNSKFTIFINNFNKKPSFDCNFDKLSKKLNVPITSCNANKISNYDFITKQNDNFIGQDYIDYITKQISQRLLKLVEPYARQNSLPTLWCAIKVLECDEGVINLLSIKEDISQYTNTDNITKIAKLRHDYIKQLLEYCSYKQTRKNNSALLDKIFLNKFLAIPLFFSIMMLIFYLTFFSVGAFLGNLLSSFVIDKIGASIANWLSTTLMPTWLTAFLSVGVIGGLGSVLAFLPQIALMFMFLAVLEDSGYISRIAFLFDDIFSCFGLSGKSIYTLLMGLGCATSACLTARNMDDKNAQIKTAIITPYMSCSAKLPIYNVIGAVFFGVYNIFVIMLIYILSFVASMFIAYFLNKTFLKSKSQSFLLEFTGYKIPKIKRLLKVLFDNIKQYLIRIGGVLILVNSVVWLMQNFSATLSYIPQSGQESMLQTFGRLFSWIFIPLGFSSYGATSALIAGLVAKEVIVASIVILNGTTKSLSQSLKDPTSAVHFSNASCLSFLVFCLLYSPCIASMAVMSKEISLKKTILAIILQFIVAYVVALIVYLTYRLFLSFKLLTIISMLSIIFILLFILFFHKLYKKTRKNCKNCAKCKK